MKKKKSSKNNTLSWIILGISLVIIILILGIIIAQKRSRGSDYRSGIVNLAQAEYEKCFFRGAEEKDSELYEYVHVRVDNNKISGTKKVHHGDYQRSGALSGSLNKEMLDVQYTYDINGFTHTEKELYSMNDHGNLVRHEYLLIEDVQNNLLILDKSVPIGETIYYAMGCKE